MHAYLVAGGTPREREKTIEELVIVWKTMPADVVRIESPEGAIKIEDVRDFSKRLLLAPFQSPWTAGIICGAAAMTVEAQNAILKLLEEPPPHARIILETQTVDSLLPTIVSRCEIKRVGESGEILEEKEIASIVALLGAPTGEVMDAIEGVATDREAAKSWVNRATAIAHNMLLAAYQQSNSNIHPSKRTIVQFLRNLDRARSQLAVNCNPKLVLDRVFLK